MPNSNPFLVDVGAYWKTPGESRHESLLGHLTDIRVLESFVPNDADVSIDADITAVIGGMEVKGNVRTPFKGQCRRCLSEVNGSLDLKVDEFYTNNPEDEETYELDDSKLDLEPLVRDAVVLDLPIAPLCRDDCAGLCATCGTNWNDSTCNCNNEVSDPRWSALESLKSELN